VDVHKLVEIRFVVPALSFKQIPSAHDNKVRLALCGAALRQTVGKNDSGVVNREHNLIDGSRRRDPTEIEVSVTKGKQNLVQRVPNMCIARLFGSSLTAVMQWSRSCLR